MEGSRVGWRSPWRRATGSFRAQWRHRSIDPASLSLSGAAGAGRPGKTGAAFHLPTYQAAAGRGKLRKCIKGKWEIKMAASCSFILFPGNREGPSSYPFVSPNRK